MDGLFYTSRGSERKHDGETDSVCLGDMVAQFMEESGAEDQLSPHTETIDGSVTEDCQTVNQSQQQLETLKGIISSSCSADSDVLAETCKSLEMANKMQQQQQPKYLKQLVICHLQNVGYNAAICKSRPQDNRTFPSGNYEYIDVILKTTNSDRSIRLFVDLDFRGQFEIARPTSEYSALLGLLPKIYVGRAHKLQSIVKIMCEAVKKSLERKGMNLPPWRKYGYMRSMWLGSYKRTATCNSVYDKNNMTSPVSSRVTEWRRMGKNGWNSVNSAGHADVAEEYLNWGSPAAVLSRKPSTGKFVISRLSCALMEAGLTSLPLKNRGLCV
eukprot:PITA_35332